MVSVIVYWALAVIPFFMVMVKRTRGRKSLEMETWVILLRMSFQVVVFRGFHLPHNPPIRLDQSDLHQLYADRSLSDASFIWILEPGRLDSRQLDHAPLWMVIH